jgi:hypothetical protein
MLSVGTPTNPNTKGGDARGRVLAPVCFDCGRPYGEEHGFPDLLIPNWAWAQIAPFEGNGLLCPSCICGRLHNKHVECEGRFTSGPLSARASGIEVAEVDNGRD